MKKLSPVGLVVEGKSASSVILRLPNLAEEIGPIKSTALRVARRLANFLHAGYGIAQYEELAECRLILVRASDQTIRRIVDDFCRSDLDLSALAIVLCESWQLMDVLAPLHARGASIGTLLPVPSTRRRWFVLEGEPRATRLTRQFIEANEGKVLELKTGRKELYFAAELLTTALPIPLFAAAQRALREAGIGGNNLQALLEEMAHKMFRDFLNASRTTWGGPLAASTPATADEYFQRLRRSYPALSAEIEAHLDLARRSGAAKSKAG
jgi:Domain of unknown function (DUF2520)